MSSGVASFVTLSQARSLLAAGSQALEERKQEINDLNVYPVPDGDTGTNLSLTMQSVLDAVEGLAESAGEREMCAAITQASLMGARGNSGVILSQIIRGAMESLGQAGPVTSESLTHAFRKATDTAYRAVRRPVEGTMLTVLREMAEAATELPAAEMGPKEFMDGVIAAGWKSVERTPSLLRVLADAGVVDAGGFGLVVLIEGVTNGRIGWEVPIATHTARAVLLDGIADAEEDYEEESEFTYCTSFLLTGQGLDRSRMEEELGSLGDSLLIVGDGSQLKVHMHTDDPGGVLSLAVSRGILSEIEISNMKEQIAARSRRLAEVSGVTPADRALTQVVAVVAGEGNEALFRSLGVDLIVEGGQSMNPSTEELVRAVEQAVAPAVVILPNNANVIMTAEHTVGLTDREVHVVPTRSIPAGLSAAVAYERRSSGGENAEMMRGAIERVVSGEVTRAVRDSLVDGVQVKTDDFIGLVDDRVVTAARDIEAVTDEVVARLLEGEKEMLTALLGDGDDAARAAAAIERARDRYPRVEIEAHKGGQPLYPLLLGAE